MQDSVWRMEFWVWSMDLEAWSTEYGVRTIEYLPRSMEHRVWKIGYGIWTMAYGVLNMEYKKVKCGNVEWTPRVIAVRKLADESLMRKVLVISGMRTESKAGL